MEHSLAVISDYLNTVLSLDFQRAIVMTVYISMASTVCAVVIGFLMAFASMSRWMLVRGAARTYVEVFRNTPLLIQLYIYFRGLAGLGIVLDPVLCGILGLSLYTGAYLAEVFRSGLLAIPRTQLEAGLALGLNPFRVYVLILIPQAIRIILPALTNQWINLIKNSSLVAFISVTDIFYMVYVGAVNESPIKYFLIGAFLYVALTLSAAGVLLLVDRLLEKRWVRFPVLVPSTGEPLGGASA